MVKNNRLTVGSDSEYFSEKEKPEHVLDVSLTSVSQPLGSEVALKIFRT